MDHDEIVTELNEGFEPYEIRDMLTERYDISEEEANKIMVKWGKDISWRFGEE
jgi:hypothetical protein